MPTIDPLFSVLIPSLPSRLDRLAALMGRLEAQIIQAGVKDDVEVLCVVDNKSRSIGLKREDLVQRARGTWLAFVDDDDDVSEDYIVKILSAIRLCTEEGRLYGGIPVIVFDQWTTIDNGEPRLVRHGIEFENTELGLNGATRKPWHHNVWWAAIAKTAHFPDASYGEDAHWLEQLWTVTNAQYRIEGPPLHHYRYDNNVTEAEHTFPGAKK